MRWTNSGLTTESAPRTAAGWEVFFPARLLFWHVGLRPAASTVPDSRSEVRARDPSPSRAFSTGASPGPALARPGGLCPPSRAAPLLPQLTPASRIELYDEYSPLFWKAQDDGLVQPNPASFGWDWTWADRRTGEAVAAWGAILEAAVAPEATTAAVVLDGVLHALEHQSNPQDRRKHYLDMRDRARRTKLDVQEWREP